MRVLIVDDEALVRVGLKSMINWESYGFELIGEASDGRIALEMAKNTPPDILITDLKMPVLDGLELIRRVKKDYPNCKIIVLSSYDDFSLVREAMKLGAADYLLKLEVEPAQLINTLRGLKDDIVQERHYRQETQTNLGVLRRDFLCHALCSHESNEADFLDSQAKLGIRFALDPIYCLVLRVGNTYRLENMGAEEVNTTNSAIINLCEEIISDDYIGYAFYTKRREFVLLLSPKKEWVTVELIINTCEKLIEMLKQYLDLTAVIGVGQGNQKLSGLKLAFREASKAIQYRFFEGNERIILWDDVRIFPTPKDSYSLIPIKSKLEQALMYLRSDELHSCLESLSQDLQSSLLSQEAVCHTLLELLTMVCEIIEQHQLKANEVLTDSYCTYYELFHLENLGEVQSWLLSLEKDLTNFITAEKAKNYPNIITQAKQYIKENYTQDISLPEVSAVVSLTPSYFSTVFKQQVGISFSEYLTQHRLTKAKELLMFTDKKVYEISHMVGYPNHYYFNRLFKRVVGLTPLDYRKSQKSTI